MSQAELTAYRFYKQHGLGAMSEDVKRHLIILMLSAPDETYTVMSKDDTTTDINARLDRAEEDMRTGRIHSCTTVHSMMEKKFTWLCE